MIRRSAWSLLIALLPVQITAGATDSVAPTTGGNGLSVQIGFDGRYKVGVWTPIRITLQPGRGEPPADRVVVTVPDGDGVPSRFSAPFAPGDSTATVYARLGRVRSRLAVEIQEDGQTIAQKVFEADPAATGFQGDRYPSAIAAERPVIVSIAAGAGTNPRSGAESAVEPDVESGMGSDPLGVQAAIVSPQQRPEQQPVAVALAGFDELPERWFGYEGVDVLVLSTSRPQCFADLKPDSPQIVALDNWIRMGGKLVFCVGLQAERVLAEDGPLRQFAPGRLEEMLTLRQAAELEGYAVSSSAIAGPADGVRPSLRVPRLAGVEGRIEAGNAALPLVIRTARGFGQVVFLAADLDGPPLDRWKDRPLLVRRLIGLPEVADDESQADAAVMYYGFNDVAGQMRSALDQFGDVRIVPFWAVVVLIFVYILLIGPGDYLFLRKIARRMQWTWLTFPTIVLGVCLAAYVLAYALKGNRLRFNEVDLVDVDAVSGQVRGTAWANVFSPRMESFQRLSLRPQLPDGTAAPNAELLFSWMGLPGSALGAMNPKTISPVLWKEAYEFSPELDAVQNVPIPVWSTKSFTARWRARTVVGIEAELSDDGQSLSGTVTNRLGYALSDCLLVFDRYAYKLETLDPGESVTIDAWLSRSELKTLLTERKFVAAEEKGGFRTLATPYDQSSVELPYVLRVMMFFEAAGGRRYTHLHNGYQRFVDFSDLLETGRAILVGRAPADRRGAELLRDGRPISEQQDRHLTMYRFVFPVKTPNVP
ncbi:MAG: hypothetical protein JXB62_06055 [Pirellulales bacterium]|nr:hypothetical protein [Pirellulales bacterium]